MDNIEVVERGNIVVNIYEGQNGATGEAGKSLRFEDLTPEQLEKLKGPKGEQGDVGPIGPQGKGGLTPEIAFTLEGNGDLYVDISYKERV